MYIYKYNTESIYYISNVSFNNINIIININVNNISAKFII